MFIKTVNISKEYALDGDATLKCFLNETDGELGGYNQNLPAMIVVPGGGYSWCSRREADPIAVEFFTRHYSAFVLDYSVAPYRYPLSLTQLAAAVDYVKTNASELGVDEKRVFVVGFSAGGHLTADLSVECDDLPVPIAGGKKLNARPTAVILSYPVIFPDSHVGSYKNLLGLSDEEATGEKAQTLALDKKVTCSTPPTFIWTTREDTCVDPTATIRHTQALQKNGVIYESHIFPYGYHGSATCDERTVAPQDLAIFEKAKIWFDLADAFCKGLK
jgi:acetyl esterase/lipase